MDLLPSMVRPESENAFARAGGFHPGSLSLQTQSALSSAAKIFGHL